MEKSFEEYDFESDVAFKQYFIQLDFPADSTEDSQMLVAKQKYYKLKVVSFIHANKRFVFI